MHGQDDKNNSLNVRIQTDKKEEENVPNAPILAAGRSKISDEPNKLKEQIKPIRRIMKESILIKSGIVKKLTEKGKSNIKEEKIITNIDKINPDGQIELPNDVKQLLISKNYSIVDYINCGTVALVFKVHKNGQFYAAKVINKTLSSIDKDRGLLELTIMQSLDHPNIIKYFDSIENNRYQVIIMEYADGGDLFAWAHSHHRTDIALVKQWFREILTGLEFLHQNGYAHRDLKADDILIVNNVAKISDFGCATFSVNLLETLETMDEPNCVRCAIEYQAPESFNTKFNAFRSDYYACGVILYVMIALQYPFAPGLDGLPDTDKPDSNIRKRIMDKNWPKVDLIQRDERLYSLLRQLLNPDPQERVSVVQALEHPWFDYDCPR